MPKVWTEKEEQYLIENYDKMTNIQLAEKFGVTPKAISHKMRRLRERMKKKPPQKPSKPEEKVPAERIFEGEKTVRIGAEGVEMIPSGFEIKTKKGWVPVMMRKSRVAPG